MENILYLTKYQCKFNTFSKGPRQNIAELAFSHLADILSDAPHEFGFKKNQILLNKISHIFIVTSTLLTGQKILFDIKSE